MEDLKLYYEELLEQKEQQYYFELATKVGYIEKYTTLKSVTQNLFKIINK